MRNHQRSPLAPEVPFETLPPVVVRKYFSSLERLRFAHDANGGGQSRPTSRLSILPPDTSTILSPGGTQLSGNRRSRRRRCSAADVTPSTVAWFSSLPPAVQRKLFSKEECSFYSQEHERNAVILDAADETLRRRSWHPIQLAAFAHRTSEDEDEDDDPAFVDIDDSADDMASYSTDGFRWLEADGELDLQLDDYHEAIAETTRRTTLVLDTMKRPSRPSTALSGLSIRRGRSSTSLSQNCIEPQSPRALPSNPAQSRASSFSFKQIRPRASMASIDPRASHYQDPAARLKLRLYLASPQKFDEAIEFGFPSVEERDRWSQHARPKTSPHTQRPEINRTFFNEDEETPSLSGDEGDDDDAEEPDTLYDPRTPDEPVFHIPRASQTKQQSVDATTPTTTTGWRSVPFRRQPETHYTRGITADREMTLHMTLTRPDLRSPEELQVLRSDSQHQHQLKDSRSSSSTSPSFKRPDLVLVDNPLTIWDSLPVEESRMKKFLRRLMLK